MSTSITKDVLVDLTLQELLIRIIQTQTAKAIEEGSFKDSNNPISEVIEFIRLNLRENITLKRLSEKSCMSTTSFYRLFKRELGMSPIDFVLHEKIRAAKKLLTNPTIQINEVCYLSGFEDANYFTRLFKKQEGITPKQYQLLQGNRIIQ
jgi:AraC-like DNA-binding protein